MWLDNKMVIGGTLLLIGATQLQWLRTNFGDMNIVTLPMLGDVTPLRALGILATASGAYILYDCCFPKEFGF